MSYSNRHYQPTDKAGNSRLLAFSSFNQMISNGPHSFTIPLEEWVNNPAIVISSGFLCRGKTVNSMKWEGWETLELTLVVYSFTQSHFVTHDRSSWDGVKSDVLFSSNVTHARMHACMLDCSQCTHICLLWTASLLARLNHLLFKCLRKQFRSGVT